MPASNLTKLCLTLILVSMLAACANFVQDQRARDRQAAIDQAMKDHERCEQEGHSFPSTGYTRCRQSLQDQREARQLHALRLIDPEDPATARDPHHRPTTARGDFRCEEREWGQTRWIDCRTYY
ncbi:hypothetical protein [Natronospira bacteriovora]|uniref:Lipoprotein n=1 Tax=Natronospira bacteriovora TaxID=3069753 RepID=A0ABU0W5T1_9GAMM|nr:hypothetical protein [Natronospira sp. AB-CW4]MDQ2069367.1 hypothetical protein [Natronospira sp. AB-CW4]